MIVHVALAAVLLVQSGMPPPDAYIHAADRERAARHQIPCVIEHVDKEGRYLGSIPTDQCFKMLPAQRMRGVWIDAFEGSQFFPGRTTAPGGRGGRPSIWLDTSRVKLPNGYAHGRRNGRAVLIDFIGRRTRYRAPSGHMGMFDYEIIVDRVISARELPGGSSGG